jgi:uncharacterized protein YjbI with pentapeptide repeats
MANSEHVKIVEQGAENIREWRENNVNQRLDLSDANFKGVNLAEADLREALLSGADLRGAILSRADLREANLREASLTAAVVNGANLRAAILSGADLSRSDFSGATLRLADLRGVDLRLANLSTADVSRSSLNVANLSNTNFEGANLSSADLSLANLSLANLSGANLYQATLRQAILSGSSLRDANVKETNFTEAILNEVDFNGAHCHSTLFANVDLSKSLGLNMIRHLGPSTVGIDTIYRSINGLPEPFLRGCGIPDSIAKMIPSLIEGIEPIQFYSCFISYSTKDDEFAKRLQSRLRDEKLRVWFAPEDLKGGQKSHDQIEQAIRLYDKLLLVLSKESMQSQWVNTEIYHARQRELQEGKQVLFPIAIIPFEEIRHWRAFDSDVGKDMAREVRECHIPDFSNWKDHDAFERGFDRLLKDLKRASVK